MFHDNKGSESRGGVSVIWVASSAWAYLTTPAFAGGKGAAAAILTGLGTSFGTGLGIIAGAAAGGGAAGIAFGKDYGPVYAGAVLGGFVGLGGGLVSGYSLSHEFMMNTLYDNNEAPAQIQSQENNNDLDDIVGQINRDIKGADLYLTNSNDQSYDALNGIQDRRRATPALS